jgi:uncharacterized membrane protein HdeD (DUF308 family)
MKKNTINPKNDNIFNLNSKIAGNKMNNEYISEENKIVKPWYLNLISGIVLVLVALWVFFCPEVTYNSLIKVFSITFLFTGLMEIISSIQYKNLLKEWRLSVVIGIFDLLVSIIFFSKSQISIEALILVMAFVFLYRAVKLIAWSTELKNYIASSCGWVLFGSIAGVILSYLFIWNRTFPQLTHIFFTSFGVLLIGISEIYFSSVLRKINRSGIVS